MKQNDGRIPYLKPFYAVELRLSIWAVIQRLKIVSLRDNSTKMKWELNNGLHGVMKKWRNSASSTRKRSKALRQRKSRNKSRKAYRCPWLRILKNLKVKKREINPWLVIAQVNNYKCLYLRLSMIGIKQKHRL